MRFEISEFDESKNPNIPHEPPSKDLWRMLRYLLMLILAIYLTIEAVIFSLPYAISLEREQRWFGFASEIIISGSKPDPTLQKIADALAVKMDLPPNIVKVHIDPSQNINAYATFGGYIVFYQGLLDSLPNEEAVVAVLAHEMAHVQHRDVLRGSARRMLFLAVIGYLTGGDAAQMAVQLDSLHYSRKLEERADAKAVQTLQQYYGTAGGMLDALHTFETGNDTNLPTWILSHPKPTQRIQAVRELATQNSYPLTQGKTPNHWKKTIHNSSSRKQQ